MATLAIDLQDGFKDDEVTLQVNGEQVCVKQHVSTSLLLGFADSFKTEVRKGPVTVTVKIATKGLVANIPLEILTTTYLGISVTKDGLEHIISQEPFGYG